MKYTDLQDKSEKELLELLKEKKLEVFTLKVKLKTMQLTNTAELSLELQKKMLQELRQLLMLLEKGKRCQKE